MHVKVIQVGSHTGSSVSDPIFNNLKSTDIAILIEPVLEYFEKLVQNCNDRFPENHFIFLNKACDQVKGSLILYQPVLEGDLPIWADELTSVRPDHVKDHGLSIETTAIRCESVTLDDIIEDFKIDDVDILCVDTEGYDYEVLRGLNLNKLKPKAIFFEHKHFEGTNLPVGSRYAELMENLLDAGYRKVFDDGANTYLALSNFDIPESYLYRE
jgi:FkbM family methyltransferase